MPEYPINASGKCSRSFTCHGIKLCRSCGNIDCCSYLSRTKLTCDFSWFILRNLLKEEKSTNRSNSNERYWIKWSGLDVNQFSRAFLCVCGEETHLWQRYPNRSAFLCAVISKESSFVIIQISFFDMESIACFTTFRWNGHMMVCMLWHQVICK